MKKYFDFKVNIIKWVGFDPQPGVVECTFQDAAGITHSIQTKCVNPSCPNELSPSSTYPILGTMKGEVVKEFVDAQGKNIVSVSIFDPYSNNSSSQQEYFYFLVDDEN